MTGTGNGDTGIAPGRKVKGFLWMAFTIIVCVTVTTKINTPEGIAIQALNLIGLGGLGTILGQSAVDTFERIALGKKGVAEANAGKTTTTESHIDITEKK